MYDGSPGSTKRPISFKQLQDAEHDLAKAEAKALVASTKKIGFGSMPAQQQQQPQQGSSSAGSGSSSSSSKKHDILSSEQLLDVVRYNAWSDSRPDFAATAVRGEPSKPYIGS